MQPSAFNESNMVLDTPKGFDPVKIQPMHAHRAEQDGIPATITCWKVSAAELEEINRTGRIWLWIIGRMHPPVHVSGVNPFEGRAIE